MRRLASTGVGIDALLGPVVAAQNQAQLRPTLAALEGEYVAAWADHRDVLDYEPGLGDVFAARLSATATLLTPNGIAVHDTPAAEGGAYLWRTGRGEALLVASTVRDGTHRLQFARYTTAAAAPWTPVGQGLAGSAGTPRLDGYGPLTGGSAFDLTVATALPNTLGVLVLGLAPVHLPLFGGVLVPSPDVTFGALVGAGGTWSFVANWPAGYAGTSFYAQGWLLDGGGPQGFAATAGLRGIAP